MAEYLTRDAVESVALNTAIPFVDSISCNKGYVFHQNGTGIFVLKKTSFVKLKNFFVALPHT